jgi:hypothetical protein
LVKTVESFQQALGSLRMQCGDLVSDLKARHQTAMDEMHFKLADALSRLDSAEGEVNALQHRYCSAL